MNNFKSTHILEKNAHKLKFQKNLLGWFDIHQRTLPWRSNPSLYKTVVSEFMLQQTRVKTVIPYFNNWINKFPNFELLANSDEDNVLKNWEGLGYYSRARNLHKLARIVCLWNSPSKDIKVWQTLPGVGPYISAAITSISFNQPNAVCDGNVVRVLARIFAINENFKDGATAQKKIQPVAQKILSLIRPGDYNQAIMELGATVCHKHNPLCTICPIQSFCTSGKKGDFEKFPIISKKRKLKKNVERLWIVSETEILLQKENNSSNRLAGIYELPKCSEKNILKKGNLICKKNRAIGQTDYSESIFHGYLDPKLELKNQTMKWVKWEEIDKITMSGPHRKWIEEIKKSFD